MLHVTGSGGWIGSAVLRAARARGIAAAALDCRDGDRARMRDALAAAAADGGAALVHLAAIAHRDPRGVAAGAYARVNRDLAVATAEAAAAAGVARFVFASSAAVMGPTPPGARPWREDDPPAPADPYAVSKRQAEQALAALHRPGRFEVVVLRPPLVWGPGVRANFLALLRLAAGPWPLPLADARGPRSMLHLDNAADALLHLAAAPGVGGRTFFATDGVDLGAADWIAAIRRAQGRGPRLFGPPRPLLRVAALADRRGRLERLFGSLRLDDSALRATGWRPPVDLDTGLARTLAWLQERGR